MASATLARAPSFSDGATESSRSRKLMSAGTVGALARKRSFDPGDDMHERRGGLRERSDMLEWYGSMGGRPKWIRDQLPAALPPASTRSARIWSISTSGVS